MKKMVLVFAASVITLFAAQSVKAQNFTFGVKGGLNLSMWTIDESSLKPGFHIGGFANIQFNEYLAIQPELMYSMMGNRMHENEEVKILGKEYYAELTQTTTSHNIVVPVMVQIIPIPSLKIEVGPQFGFNLGMSSHIKFETNVAGQNNYERDMDVEKDTYNLFEFGIAAGLSYDITKNIIVGARYNYGITPLADETKAGDVVLNEAVHTHNIMISLGYRF